MVVEATDQLGDYYQAMDALCLPSYTEGYGLVSMEAMCIRKIERLMSGTFMMGSP